jgi:hypothetical protein
VVDAATTGDARRDRASIDLPPLESAAPAPGGPWFA